VILGVVIVTFGRTHHLHQLLESLAVGTYLPDEVVVVNNSPVDRLVPSAFDGLLQCPVRIIEFGGGLNVAAARNAGAAALSSDVILFIDDDNLVDKRLCEHLVATFEKSPEVPAAGPLMRSLRSGRIWCAGVRHQPWTGHTVFVGSAEEDWDDSWPRTSPDLPNCYALRSEVFSALGGFDERLFPFHFEEADLGARLYELTGKEFMIVPSAVTYHDVADQASSGSVLLKGLRQGGNPRVRQIARSRVLFFGTHTRSVARRLLLLASLPLWASLVSVSALRQSAPWSERRKAVVQLWIGLIDGYRRLTIPRVLDSSREIGRAHV